MTPEKLLEILSAAARLKTVPRHCWTAPDRRESVADHSWRLALTAMLLGDEEEFRSLDIGRVIRMCLIHDLGEAFTGDIPTFRKTDGDRAGEEERFDGWVDGFPEPQRGRWRALLREMRALETPEARLYRALDRLEAVISHNESDISTWLPLEYGLQLTYGAEETAGSPALRALKAAVDRQTLAKIAREARERPAAAAEAPADGPLGWDDLAAADLSAMTPAQLQALLPRVEALSGALVRQEPADSLSPEYDLWLDRLEKLETVCDWIRDRLDGE